MISLVIDLSKAANKPYGHTAYTRRTKSGKLVQVKAKGVKPQALPTKGPVLSIPLKEPESAKAPIAFGNVKKTKKKKAEGRVSPKDRWAKWVDDFVWQVYDEKEEEIDALWKQHVPPTVPDSINDRVTFWLRSLVNPNIRELPAANEGSIFRWLTLYGDSLVVRGIYPTNPATGRKITSKGGFRKAIQNAVVSVTESIAKRTGFKITHPGPAMKGTKEENIFAIVRAVEGLEKVFAIDPETHGCEVIVKSLYNGVNAQYQGWNNQITIDTNKGRESFFHEFGHLLDYKALLGRFQSSQLGAADVAVENYVAAVKSQHKAVDVLEEAGGYREWDVLRAKKKQDKAIKAAAKTQDKKVLLAAEKAGNERFNAEHRSELFGKVQRYEREAEAAQSEVEKYGEAAQWCYALRNETDYYETLAKNPSANRIDYLGKPTEVFARYFDQWVFTRLTEKGYTPQDFHVRNPLETAANEPGWAFTDEQFDHMRVYFEDLVGAKVLKAILGIFLQKSLLDDNPHRQKDYAHIARTQGGKRGRSPQHQAKDDYSLTDWLSDTRSKLSDFAAGSLEEGHDSAEQWLRDRGIRLPDGDDAVTRRTANNWLTSYGHTVFALGIHLTDPSGKTIASPEELPKIEKGLVVNDDVLWKAGRMRGAKGKAKMERTTFGAIEFLDSGKVRYLEKKDVGKENQILANYAKKRVAVHYHPPSIATGPGFKAAMVQRERETQARLAREAKQQAALASRKAPSPVAANIQDVAAQLEEQRGEEGAAISMVQVLKERVSVWSPPKKYRAAIDPVYREEFDQLISQKRALSRKLKGGAGGTQAMAAMSADYRELMRRINQIRGKALAVEGGGKVQIGTRSFQFLDHGVVDDEENPLPYRDLGFEPQNKPMSYLLSVTEWPRVQSGKRKGELELSKNQYDALQWEFSQVVRSTVGRIANSYDLYDVFETSDGKKVRRLNAEGQDLLQDAWLMFFNMATEWKPFKDGSPSPSNNFPRFVYGLFPSRLKDHFAAQRKEQGKEVFVEDLESMPEMSGGKKLTPGARIESPEDTLRRRGLSRWVTSIFSEHLSDPVQLAVVESRLNIYNPQDTGIKDDLLTWPESVRDQGIRYKEPRRPVLKEGEEPPPPEEEVAELAGFGLKPWKTIKQDVLERIGTMALSPDEKEKRRKMIQAMAPSDLHRMYFAPAMESLRSASQGLTFQERKAVAEFATLHAKYLQGIRHESWDPSDTVSRLVTSAPEPVSPEKIQKLIEKRQALVDKLKGTKVGTKAQAELLERKKKVSRELGELRSQASYHRGQGVAQQKFDIEKYNIDAASFWNKTNRQKVTMPDGKEKMRSVPDPDIGSLVSMLGIDTSYRAYRKTPNTSLPPGMEAHKLKAEAYYQLLQNLKNVPVDQLRARLGKEIPPQVVKLGKRTVHANIPREHYDAMLRYWFKRKGGLKKSFVISDYDAAWDNLIEECLVWEMNEWRP